MMQPRMERPASVAGGTVSPALPVKGKNPPNPTRRQFLHLLENTVPNANWCETLPVMSKRSGTCLLADTPATG